jgi:hypothetical protein
MRAQDQQVVDQIVTRRGGFGHREHLELAWNYLQERNPDLLDRRLIGHFFSPQRIGTETARAAWTSPDLRGLPALV